MRLNSRIKGFLLNLIKPSSNQKEILRARRALQIIERGIVTENDMSWLEEIGYKG